MSGSGFVIVIGLASAAACGASFSMSGEVQTLTFVVGLVGGAYSVLDSLTA